MLPSRRLKARYVLPTRGTRVDDEGLAGVLSVDCAGECERARAEIRKRDVHRAPFAKGREPPQGQREEPRPRGYLGSVAIRVAPPKGASEARKLDAPWWRSGRLRPLPRSRFTGSVDDRSLCQRWREDVFGGRRDREWKGFEIGRYLVAAALGAQHGVAARSVLTESGLFKMLALGATTRALNHPARASMLIRAAQGG